MELEVKHLAPYLPYGLKLQYIERHKVVSSGVMQSITQNNSETHPTKVSIDFYNKEYIWMFKPILRRKEYLLNLKNEILLRWGGGLPDSVVAKKYWVKGIIENMMFSAFNVLTYDEFQLMMEYHIDVFNLIDNGLAVEMETFNS